MEFGVHVGTRGAAGDPDGLVAIATHAESLGLGYLGVSDHIVIAEEVETFYPYSGNGKWFAQDTGFCLDQLAVLSYAAAVTESIRLLTSVMVLPYREPLLAAKMLATVDVLSRGRVTAGVGAGWMAEEMELLGSPPFEARGRVADEYIEAFRNLWTEAHPRYAGEHARFEKLLFTPKPIQDPHLPIWVGGESRAARRRAARLGDGWYPVSNNPGAPLDTPERYGAALAEMREMADAAGRDASILDTALLAIGYRLDASAAGPSGERARFTGRAEDIIGDICAFRDAGLQTLIIGFESAELQLSLDRIEAFAKDVMPHCS